ncbi:MAG: hypothetical protein M3511_15115 [Deinococcota bacterium]|jgi:hypothetical protein|nr:hypothetical protein [Deinococcota bacterium]
MILGKRLERLEQSLLLQGLTLKGEYPDAPMEQWARADLERFIAEYDAADPEGAARLNAMSKDELRAVAEGRA